jgi:hypothetical protein
MCSSLDTLAQQDATQTTHLANLSAAASGLASPSNLSSLVDTTKRLHETPKTTVDSLQTAVSSELTRMNSLLTALREQDKRHHAAAKVKGA